MAGTVIDSLVLELGLDASKFTSGQRAAIDSLRKFQEQAVSGGKEIESQSRRIFELVGGLRTAFLTTIGGFIGGQIGAQIAGFANNLLNADAALGRLGRTMGISASDLSAWQGAFKQMGMSGESATGALQGLSGEMTRFTMTGQSTMLPVLSRLGVSLFDSNNRLKTSTQLWLDLAEAVEKMDPRDAAAFLAMIPGANQEMINFALKGRKAMEDYIAAGRPTEEMMRRNIELADEYQKAIGRLEVSATDLGRVFTVAVAPPVSAMADRTAEWLKSIREGRDQASLIVKDLREAAEAAQRGDAGEAGSKLLSALFGDFHLFSGAAGPLSPEEERIRAANMGAGAGVGGWRRGAALRVKPGAGMASPAVEALAADIQANVPGLRQFTAFNDAHHGGRGAHGAGRALDFTVEDPSQYASTAARVRALLAQRGIAATVDDESTRRSAGWTGPHIHVALGNAAGMAPGLAGGRGGAGGGVTVNGITVHIDAQGATGTENIVKEVGPALMRSITAAGAETGRN